MATKKHFSKGLQAMALLAGVTAFTACNDKYHYDPNYQKEVYAASWAEKFGEVDPNQDWCMATIASVSATVDQDGTFYLFNGDPLNKATSTTCIAQIAAKQGQTINANVDIVEGTQFVYAALYSDGYMRVQPVMVEDGKISVNFGEQTTRAAKVRQVVVKKNELSWNPGEMKTSAPSDAITYTSNLWDNVKDASYIVGEGVTQINAKNNSDFYIQGNVELSKVYVSPTSWDASTNSNITRPNTNIYVLPNSTLTLPNGAINDKRYNFYVASGAKLVMTTPNVSSSNIYNQGTIEVTGLTDFNETSVVINEGDITVNGDLKSRNGETQIWNKGNLTANNIDNEGSSSFYNEGAGVVNVAETSTINSNGDGWQNDGHWTTKYMVVNSGSSRWINACYLTCTEKFTLNLGDATPDASYFAIDGGGAVVTKDLAFDHGTIKMGSKALFKVTGTATFGSLKKETGFIATGDDYAVVQMNKAVMGIAGQGYSAVYHGKLYVASDDHFAQGWSGQYPYILLDGGAEMTGYNNSNVTISGSACSPGYTPKKETTPPVVTGQLFILACEDLGSTDDYDFNDVVFGVEYVGGDTEATIVPLAAGGTIPAKIAYESQAIGEIHALLSSQSTSTMINTTSYNESLAQKKTITVPSNWSFVESYKKFKIIVEGENAVEVTAPNAGEAPQMIIVPGAWEWPIERTKIEDAYPSFINWNADATVANWNATKVASKVVKR